MKVIPDDLYPADAKTDEERFAVLAKRLFAADPAQVKAQLEAQQATPPDPDQPRKPGRPRKKEA